MSRAAAIQMTSGADVAANLASARTLLEAARARGAEVAALPENFALMGRSDADKLAIAEALDDGPIQAFLAQTARELGMWIIAGTIPLQSQDPAARVSAACLVFDAHGARVARYDKIHLFDVDVADRQGRYRESATIVPGQQPVIVDTPIGRVGLAVCYDVRFPELFRLLLGQGAEVLCLPSAFTVPTGRAHWNLLVRARAVENLCYLLAPAQAGMHDNGRETWGETLIVDPWGEVLEQVAQPMPGVAVAQIDRTLQKELRARFPALAHRRLVLPAQPQ